MSICRYVSIEYGFHELLNKGLLLTEQVSKVDFFKALYFGFFF